MNMGAETQQPTELNVVTGAFGYTGSYIAKQLLSQGLEVRTLTGHVEKHNPFGPRVSVAPFNFECPERLVESLRGATTLYNTYWIRFDHRNINFDQAITNSLRLIRAAEKAGIARIVHVSITNASPDSPFPYFRSKALVEQAVIESGLSYAIIRPTLIFGREDILLNNITWLLRRFPVFALPGKSDCRIQPIYVEDLAKLAVDAARRTESIAIDAVGPDIYSFKQLVQLVANCVGSRARLVHLSPRLVLLAAKLLGLVIKDTVLTADELHGLLSNLLVSSGPATGHTRLADWLPEHAVHLGNSYSSELNRHYR